MAEQISPVPSHAKLLVKPGTDTGLEEDDAQDAMTFSPTWLDWFLKLAQSVRAGAGAVTSVDVAVPGGEFSSSGGPVTGSGTITITKQAQNANTVWAGPTGGAAAVPTFRVLAAADFPLSGTTAGTFTKVTVNTRGLVTAGTTLINADLPLTGIGAGTYTKVTVNTAGVATAGTTLAASDIPATITRTSYTTAESAITVGASPYTYQNPNAYPGLVIIQGGTVTKIEYTRDNANFYDVGLTAGSFYIAPSDRIRITHGGAPTATFFPV